MKDYVKEIIRPRMHRFSAPSAAQKCMYLCVGVGATTPLTTTGK